MRASITKIVFFVVIIVEGLFLTAGTVSILRIPDMKASYNDNDISVSEVDAGLWAGSPEIGLPGKGIYGVTVYLEPHESPFTIHTNSSNENMTGVGEIKSDGPDTEINYDIYARIPIDIGLEIMFEDKEAVSATPVRRIDVDLKRGQTLAVFLVGTLFFAILIDLFLWCTHFRQTVVRSFIKKHGVFLVTCVFTILICSIPLMTRGILDGDDKEFHLMRIQGLADGIKSGYFPVKIQPGWYNGFTYPVGVYYGQILLYPSAILRMLGFPLGFTYKIYVVLINTLTFGITYFASNKITRDKNISLGITFFYMLSLYRLVNLYKRYAAGEAQAMAFLPLFVLGFAVLYGVIESKENNGWLYLTIATTGLINSHAITTFLAVIMSLIFIQMNVKKTFTKYTLIQYGKFFAWTIVLNLFYLVPFFDYLLNFRKKVDSQMGKKMAAKAAYLPQLFSQAYSVTGHNGSYTANGDMPLSIGVSALPILVVFILLLISDKEKKNKKLMRDILVLFSISAIMCTALFPYNYLETYANKVYEVLQKIEYPWRFLSFASAFMFCIFVITVIVIKDGYGRKMMWLFMAAVLLITFWQGTDLMNRIVNENPAFDTYSVINPYWATGEYLPSNTDMEELGYTDVLTSDPGVVVSDMVRNGVDITIDVANNTQDTGYVQLPLLCYPYYRTEDGDGHELETIPGDYRKLCFGVPAGYAGKVHTFFKEPVLWRLSEFISLLAMIILIVREIRKSRGDIFRQGT